MDKWVWQECVHRHVYVWRLLPFWELYIHENDQSHVGNNHESTFSCIVQYHIYWKHYHSQSVLLCFILAHGRSALCLCHFISLFRTMKRRKSSIHRCVCFVVCYIWRLSTMFVWLILDSVHYLPFNTAEWCFYRLLLSVLKIIVLLG